MIIINKIFYYELKNISSKGDNDVTLKMLE